MTRRPWFPDEFPNGSRAAVIAEQLRAAQELDLKLAQASYSANREELIVKYVLRQFLVFGQEAAKLASTWPIDEITDAADEFLRRTTIDAQNEKAPWLRENWATEGYLHRKFDKHPKWKRFQQILLDIAEAQARGMATTSASEALQPRRGYAREVDEYMRRKGLSTLAEAAASLNIDVSALKSIRSSRGKLRYSEATLNRVLALIGCGKTQPA